MQLKDDDARLAQSLFCSAEWALICESLDLTHRESEIVQAVLDDMSESDIAQNLGISRHTVHAHIERVYGKLGVSSRLQLVVRIFVEYISLGRRKQCIVAPRPCPLRRGHLSRGRLHS